MGGRTFSAVRPYSWIPPAGVFPVADCAIVRMDIPHCSKAQGRPATNSIRRIEMADFEPIFEKVIELEGGYHLHTVAGDRGGTTYALLAW